MGRTPLVLAALIALPSMVQAASPPPDRRSASLPPPIQRALIRSGSDAYDATTGAARRLYGIATQALGGDAVTASLRYLQRESRSFGLSADASELQLMSVHRGAGSQHVRFRQRWNGIPVWASDVVVSLTEDGRVTSAASDAWPGVVSGTSSPALDEARAGDLAARDVGIEPEDVHPCSELYVYPLAPPARLAWRVTFKAPDSPRWWEVFVDAATGAVLSRRDLTWYVDGSGYVFDPDPLTTAHVVGQQPGYRDSLDLASPQLNAQRQLRTLRDIRLSGGVYSLQGPYVRIEDIELPADPPYTATHADSFRFTRTDQAFEAVMVYYHIDTIQRWIQSLGHTAANNDSQRCDPNGTYPDDNAWYVPGLPCGPATGDYIAFGQIGVDCAEDAGVIAHEYGHAIHDDQVPGWGLFVEGRAMGEGFGDYLAASYAASIDTFNQNWIAKWKGSDYIPDGLRPMVNSKHYPEDLDPDREVHNDGEIWSACLWQIHGLLGRVITDRIVLQSHHYLLPGASFHDGAEAILEADARLYGGAHLAAIQAIFEARGILGPEPFAVSHMEQSRGVAVALDQRPDGGRQFFLVWYNEQGLDGADILGARLSASGAVLETDIPVATTVDGEDSPDVGYVARTAGFHVRDSFLVVYNRGPACDDCGCLTVVDVWGTWVDAEGDTSRHFLITNQSYQGGALPRVASVVDGDGRTLVVWGGEFWNADDCSIVKQGLFAARVDIDTGLMDPGGFFIAPTTSNYGWDVAYGAGRFLVVWNDNGDIRGAIVHPDTSILGPFDISTDPANEDDASVTFDGTRFLVAWQHGFDIFAARVDTLGVVAAPGPFQVSRTQFSDYNPAVAAGDSVAMVAWTYTPIDLSTSTEYYEIRGTTIPPYAPDSVDVSWTIEQLSVPGYASVNFGPAIAYAGQSFLVAWEDSLPTHIQAALVQKFVRDSFILDVPPPPAAAPVLALSAPHPNPTQAASVVLFSLPAKGHAALDVYDLAGRLVRRVLDEDLKAGSHRAVWDGQDRSGRRAAAGVYFMRLTTPAGSRTRRVVMRP